MDCPRVRAWQSQRVTRRSFLLVPEPPLLGAVFQPVPSQSGQTCAGALITWDLITWGPSIFARKSSASTLHPGASFAQAGKPAFLCTSCEGWAWSVESVGKPSPKSGKPLGEAQFGLERCETGFPRGFSQLTFATFGGEYEPSGFPTQP